MDERQRFPVGPLTEPPEVSTLRFASGAGSLHSAANIAADESMIAQTSSCVLTRSEGTREGTAVDREIENAYTTVR